MKRAVVFAVVVLSACSSTRENDAGMAGSAGQGGADASVEDAPSEASDAQTDAVEAASGDALADAALPECPRFEAGVSRGSIAASALVEISGLVASRKNARVLWLHNDSGHPAEVFAVRDDGVSLGVFALSGANSVDWEDIALGPGPTAGEEYLYLGDIGDNDGRRTSIIVYRVSEPIVDAQAAPRIETLANVAALELVYPDGAHNAETLLSDPGSGDLFVVTKADSGDSRVYRVPAPVSTNAPNTLAFVTALAFGKAPLTGSALTTGGDIGSRGDVLIRSYDSAFLWRRRAGDSVADALTGEPCPVPMVNKEKGEAIGFAPGEAGYFSANESASELYFYAPLP